MSSGYSLFPAGLTHLDVAEVAFPLQLLAFPPASALFFFIIIIGGFFSALLDTGAEPRSAAGMS